MMSRLYLAAASVSLALALKFSVDDSYENAAIAIVFALAACAMHGHFTKKNPPE